MSLGFFPGWSPELARRGRDKFFAAGNQLYEGRVFADDTRPLPKAFCLSGLLKWVYDQGQVGSCFANMMASVLQLMILALISAGYKGEPFNPSRRLIWYRTRQLDGSLGSRSDGGSIVNSFASCGPKPAGIGDCSEELWPYQASHNWLEQTPPASVLKAADAIHVKSIAELGWDPQAIKRSIYNGKPVGIGFDWSSGWDRGYIDAYGRTTRVGGNDGGHAVTIIGWIEDWDGYTWYRILNSHGEIYPKPPPEIEARIQGYASSGSCFFAREDHLAELLQRRWAEVYVGSEVTTFETKQLTVGEALSV